MPPWIDDVVHRLLPTHVVAEASVVVVVIVVVCFAVALIGRLIRRAAPHSFRSL